jgi:hypothetical protein
MLVVVVVVSLCVGGCAVLAKEVIHALHGVGSDPE